MDVPMSRTHLFLIWFMLASSIAYLGIPLRGALTVALSLVLHASLGTYVLGRLLSPYRPTLLMFCGPGLILGGALAFAIFQLAGRGNWGLVVSTGVCLFTLLSTRRDDHEIRGLWRERGILLQVLGLAALVMSSEFSWLLLIAMGCLLYGSLVIPTNSVPRYLQIAGVILFSIAVLIGARIRGDLWWVVTDDYNLFEVIARHVTESGLTSPWGAISFLRYHWLSYGWAGLLDILALSPGPLATISRVMPFVYSIAMASSLLMVATRLAKRGTHKAFILLPVWLVLTNTRIDWSATSTAGVFAVLSALLATMLVFSIARTCLVKRVLVYSLFGLIVILTKVPSVLTLPSLILGYEVLNLVSGTSDKRRLALGVTTTTIAGLSSLALLLPFRSVVGGIQLISLRDLSELSEGSTLILSIFHSVVRNAWIPVSILVVIVLLHRLNSRTMTSDVVLVVSLAPLFVTGVLMNSVILSTEKSNPQEYFSGPNNFLSSLSILLIANLALNPRGNSSTRPLLTRQSELLLVLAIAVMFFVVTNLLTSNDTPSTGLLASDLRIWIGVLVLCLLTRLKKDVGATAAILTLTFASLSMGVGLLKIAGTTYEDLQDLGSPDEEIETILGTSEIQEVGVWLSENSSSGQMVATNHLFSSESENIYGDDYSLAVWSQREFLVLGPKFLDAQIVASRAIDLSIQFAERPTESVSKQLSELGVAWFVVDKSVTERRNWEPFGRTVFDNRSFAILKLMSAH